MKIYYCFFEYYATGEGRTVSMALVVAKNRPAAVKSFLKDEVLRCCETNEDSISYYKSGVEVLDPAKPKELKKLRTKMEGAIQKDMVDLLLSMEARGAVREFRFTFYINAS